MDIIRVASFAQGDKGGNPAGVVIVDQLPDSADMQAAAAQVGYSETVFAEPKGDGWRARYFSPEHEVPFCGHATIALGAVLGRKFGAGDYPLHLTNDQITVKAAKGGTAWSAELQSPRTWSKALPDGLRAQLLDLFGLTQGDLDDRIPPTLAFAGVQHAVFTLTSREQLAAMDYPFEAVKAAMTDANLTTVTLAHISSPTEFATRNPFAVGGVVEDPATGAAAAAFGGMLVDQGWDGLQNGGKFTIIQGEDMGAPSRLIVTVTGRKGDSVAVAGSVRDI